MLELAVGAGANFPFYSPTVKVIATDFSNVMLEKAKLGAEDYPFDVTFICSHVEDLNFTHQSFDTVISTLSLCSYQNLSKVLDKINRWCRPEGKILLMEHGISSNYAISTLQKALNPLLYRIYGCHYTRDILELVRQSGIAIEKVESYWLNMVHLIWAAPRSSQQKADMSLEL